MINNIIKKLQLKLKEDKSGNYNKIQTYDTRAEEMPK